MLSFDEYTVEDNLKRDVIIVKESLSLEQLKELIQKVLETDDYITIQQKERDEQTSFSFTIQVSSGRPIANGFQFHVNGGFINIEIPEPQFFEEVVPEETVVQLNWTYDDEKPKGYWLTMGNPHTRLFFHGTTVMDILESI